MKIGHYDSELGSKGGVTTYIRRIGSAQEAAGNTVYYFSNRLCADTVAARNPPILVSSNDEMYSQAKSLGLDVLHLHKGVTQIPPKDLSVIRTLHGHQPYCPSGSKFLKRWNKPCDRPYSLSGCLWGHFVDGCGSIRPHNIQFDFEYTHREMATLSHMPIVVVSQFLKQQLVTAGYRSDRIHVLHLAAPESASYVLPTQSGVPQFVFLGRLAPEKGISFLLHAFKDVQVPAHLNIAGEGYQDLEMQQLSEKLGLNDCVTFHGWLNQAQSISLLQNARAVIFPSLWHEPAGFISLEAAAVGRAIISTQVGGIPEYAELLNNTLLVQPTDVSGLTAAMTQLVNEWAFAKALGEAGYSNVKQFFSLEQHLESLMQLYQQSANHLLVKVAER